MTNRMRIRGEGGLWKGGMKKWKGGERRERGTVVRGREVSW